MIELALVLPLLAILVCATIDFGRYYQAWNEAKNAAREGALYAERYPNQQVPNSGVCATPNNIQDKALQELEANESDATFTVTVTATSPTGTARPAVPGGCGASSNPATAVIKPGDTVKVRVSRHVDLITPVAARVIGDVDIVASVSTQVQG